MPSRVRLIFLSLLQNHQSIQKEYQNTLKTLFENLTHLYKLKFLFQCLSILLFEIFYINNKILLFWVNKILSSVNNF
jgi:hypothetical protein